MDDRPGFRRIGIFGLGLIGGSIALAARRAWPDVSLFGVDSEQEVVGEALRRGIVDEGETALASLAGADLVVLAAPVQACIASVSALARHTSEGALLTDAGSTKRCMVAAARAAGCEGRFVGGHPIAGTAHRGLRHAAADLFAGRTWVLTPEADTPATAVAAVEQFVAGLGAVPRTLSAGDHDRLMAVVSHVPQLVASALMQLAGEMAGDEGLALSGSGLADTTRLASSPAGIWRDVCATNADNIAPALRALAAALAELEADLPRGVALERLFSRASFWRSRLPQGDAPASRDAGS